jgi:hypothetical protein
MRIHLNITGYAPENILQAALRAAQRDGQISPDVIFDQLSTAGSRSHAASVDVHLVSLTGGKGTTHPRRPNSGTYGADGTADVYAATYDEWGWFLAHVFRADPTAKATYYGSADDFHATTGNAYRIPAQAAN